MTIGSTYVPLVSVNGFLCRDCTDVDYAKKNIDPRHPKSGPFGIDAKDDPTAPQILNSITVTSAQPPGGVTAKQAPAAPQSAAGAAPTPAPAVSTGAGTQLDVSA